MLAVILQRRTRYLVGGMFVLAGSLMTLGCKEPDNQLEIGEVTGVVTLDSVPLPNASVSFAQPGYRPSLGKTNDEGRYELTYIRNIKGATVGKHIVRIKLFAEDEQQQIEQLPARYNSDSELTREVMPGKNTFDFQLKSIP